jgi:hypothetical protein
VEPDPLQVLENGATRLDDPGSLRAEDDPDRPDHAEFQGAGNPPGFLVVEDDPFGNEIGGEDKRFRLPL